MILHYISYWIRAFWVEAALSPGSSWRPGDWPGEEGWHRSHCGCWKGGSPSRVTPHGASWTVTIGIARQLAPGVISSCGLLWTRLRDTDIAGIHPGQKVIGSCCAWGRLLLHKRSRNKEFQRLSSNKGQHLFHISCQIGNPVIFSRAVWQLERDWSWYKFLTVSFFIQLNLQKACFSF